jgi:hypothetical protein
MALGNKENTTQPYNSIEKILERPLKRDQVLDLLQQQLHMEDGATSTACWTSTGDEPFRPGSAGTSSRKKAGSGATALHLLRTARRRNLAVKSRRRRAPKPLLHPIDAAVKLTSFFKPQRPIGGKSNVATSNSEEAHEPLPTRCRRGCSAPHSPSPPWPARRSVTLHTPRRRTSLDEGQ